MAASLGYISALWCVLDHTWWTNIMIKFLSSTKMQSYLSTQSPDKPTQMPRFKIGLTNNFFQFDMKDENSWFIITPTLEHRKLPAVFGPKDVTPVSRRAFGRTGHAEIYTRAQLSEFWDNILISAASRKALQKFSRELIAPKTAIHGPEQYSYYAPRTDFYVENMISPQLLQRSVYGNV